MSFTKWHLAFEDEDNPVVVLIEMQFQHYPLYRYRPGKSTVGLAKLTHRLESQHNLVEDQHGEENGIDEGPWLI